MCAAQVHVPLPCGDEPTCRHPSVRYENAKANGEWCALNSPRCLFGYPRQESVATFYGVAGGPDCTAGIAELPIPFRLA
ncbi:hypothetical protein RSP03_41980 [Cereibacter sphaeroides]|jgi:hypothetical protein|nr:hypothetical protein RSP03_41980 [Cereibacter sphaeroides]